MPRNLEMQKQYNRAYYAANRERIRAQQNAHRSANQARITAARKGLTLDEVACLSARQGGLCAICSAALVSPHIDHDHACCPGTTSCGSCVRGLLCASCNHMLGKAYDNPRVLEAGARYLRERGC